ncbi:hypothetical protein BYT27DRAFT_7201470 [Phlegmacium glaucopus]|nr:hypothetical protein BYT27DRAFT_7201470 [Phlegmacium glaucopus]
MFPIRSQTSQQETPSLISLPAAYCPMDLDSTFDSDARRFAEAFSALSLLPSPTEGGVSSNRRVRKQKEVLQGKRQNHEVKPEKRGRKTTNKPSFCCTIRGCSSTLTTKHRLKIHLKVIHRHVCEACHLYASPNRSDLLRHSIICKYVVRT